VVIFAAMSAPAASPPPDHPLPHSVRLFPLPDHVLLPEVRAPYRVFEPRYTAMVADLLALESADRWLAVPRLTNGWRTDYNGSPPFERVATIARVEHIEPLPGSEYRIVVRGVGRVSLDEIPSDGPYRVARVEPLPDHPVTDPEALARAYTTVVQLVASLATLVTGAASEILDGVAGSRDVETNVYLLGSQFLLNADWRQRFLESRDLVLRTVMLEDILAATLALARSATADDALPS
jgi:hypothetical protein